MTILYLGLDPTNWPEKNLVHYPVIRTEKRNVSKALHVWPQCTHVIFTSRSAVRYWREEAVFFEKKKIIAIGKATAKELPHPSLIAPRPTQEGVIELLEMLELKDAYLFLPRSRRARNTLPEYLKRKNICFFSFDLYDTVFQRPEPVPNLAHFDEIVFTSPSTVEGFLRIFESFPKHCKLTAIGPITLTKIVS